MNQAINPKHLKKADNVDQTLSCKFCAVLTLDLKLAVKVRTAKGLHVIANEAVRRLAVVLVEISYIYK